jgi:hypothetical protein
LIRSYLLFSAAFALGVAGAIATGVGRRDRAKDLLDKLKG